MGAEEVYDCTPRYLATLCKQLELNRKHDQWLPEFMFGQLIAMVANSGNLRFKKPKEARDFMPSEWSKKLEPKQFPDLTPQQIAKKLKDLLKGHRK